MLRQSLAAGSVLECGGKQTAYQEPCRCACPCQDCRERWPLLAGRLVFGEVAILTDDDVLIVLKLAHALAPFDLDL